MQDARENPIAAAAAAAAVSGGAAPTANNAENLLDFDFDGAAPASAQKTPSAGSSGLEGLAGTPQRVESPALQSHPASMTPANNLDDLMGVFGAGESQAGNGSADLMNGLGGLQIADAAAKKNEDILGLF